ncbi:MAG: amidohydrolase family protein, partial [Gemmatimonadetes bacterium]|nr:amidohydrolase family protein [Gemmatimonadota bacterium]
LDALWFQDALAAWEKGDARRPEENASLRALLPVVTGAQRLWMTSENVLMHARATAIAREFGLAPVIVSGNSDEYRRLPEVLAQWKDARASLVLTLKFPEAPDVSDPDQAVAVELNDLIHWERAPGNPAAVNAAGVSFAVSTQGLDDRADVFERLREAIRYGLPADVALAALTTRPAELLGLASRLGTIEPGKDANLAVTTGDLFDPGTKVEEVWIEGRRFGEDARRATEDDVTRRWRLSVGENGGTLDFALEKKDGALVGRVIPPRTPDAAAPDSAEDREGTELADVSFERGVVSFTVPESAWDGDETRVVLRRDGPFLAGEAHVRRAVAVARARPLERPEKREPLEVLSAAVAPWPPVAVAADRPAAVLVTGATVWTCGPAGVLENADLLVIGGKIRQVGRGISPPKNARVIDGKGKHVTPGLIDCHSHSSITGGVNECTNSCTAEVRIGDVVNPESPAIYRELAGGLTISNLLHGSCNPIGGQNAVIKLKWGEPASALIIPDAPPGIKFALGENVKQSNWDLMPKDRTRYPQTRMGVEQFLRERFLAARDYRERLDAWSRRHEGEPPRHVLQLDALVEILDGERLVHCHSYRADEIIALMRVAEDMGFTVGTFQHVLEGYKCADEIAAHGAGASSFSDWWSYKYEVIDAIPYNGAIMWERGVNVSFNSDSAELSRRMNLEAAKAVKYGGVPPEEALCFVTRNPAQQLGIFERVGSLETGKDGDFVIWSGDPLSDFSLPLETWIEGVRRFSRDDDAKARPAAAELREKLVAKAEKAGGDGKDRKGKRKRGESAFGEMWQTSDVAHLERGECIDSCCGEGGE